MRIISYVFLIILMILGITFSLLNAELVTLHYYLGTQQIPLSLLLVLVLALGALLGLLVALRVWLRLTRENLHLKHQLKQQVNKTPTISVLGEH